MPKGQTPKQRRFRKETKPIRQTIRQLKQEVGLRGDNDRLNDVRDKIEGAMKRFLGPVPGVGMSLRARNVMEKIKKIKPAGKPSKTDEKRAAEMSTGGEVDIDMTTEMDV